MFGQIGRPAQLRVVEEKARGFRLARTTGSMMLKKCILILSCF